MATVNLGSIKFKWKGTYSGATAYTVDDVVEYNGSSYICKLASTGNLPTNTTYFDVMSQAGTDGTDVGTTLTTQGDILYRDGSGLQRLGAGTAGQYLQTGGAGANPSWSSVSGYTNSDALTLFNASGSAPVYACRAWVNFNGAGTVAIRGSGNVTSITDNKTGDYTVNFTTAIQDANYSAGGFCREDTTDGGNNPTNRALNLARVSSGVATSGVRVCIANFSGGHTDAETVNVVVFR
jgi:hypothetical protein